MTHNSWSWDTHTVWLFICAPNIMVLMPISWGYTDKHIHSRSMVLNGIKCLRDKLNVTCISFIILYIILISLYLLYIIDDHLSYVTCMIS